MNEDNSRSDNKYTDANRPGISFNLLTGKVQIHRTTLKILGFPEFYRFLFNPEKKMLAIQRCGIDDAGAHKLPKIIKNESCEVNSKDFLKLMYHSCSWNPYTSYRITGNAYEKERTATFDLTEAAILNEK